MTKSFKSKSKIYSTLCFFALISSVILYSQPSFALAKLGHQVVCQLAFDHLSTAKQHRVTQLLHAVPRKQQTLINQYNHNRADSPITFAKACTWADAVKNQKAFKQYNTWHYMNVSRELTRITSKPLCSKNCIPQAILTHQKQLQTIPRSWESAQALLFLGHWLADIHQPLHVSYASDLGGNKIRLVETKSNCKNLHAYWDSCLMKSAGRTQNEWVESLTAQWNSISIPKFYYQQVWDWANESYQIVRQADFQYCQITNQGECKQTASSIKLADNYPNKHLPIMEKQLLKAAKRLTRILESTL
ncbi:S1/P1 nuclease [Colwellia sp. E2M01]|uniref:S1/P1 nuclease n=1 Tax=Colwellia sp. E2M01 TaxID=2841561 RepID=UPI001C0A3196|nr:S1/P1 nuclease [Colwellia sp. E2M01]MBU2869139.1 S1/P1 nuclease [Colwellia sp. E2M01]